MNPRMWKIVLTVALVLVAVFCVRQLGRKTKETSSRLAGLPPFKEKGKHSIDDMHKLSDRQKEEFFLNYIQPETDVCKRHTRFGNVGDGGWFVCSDASYSPPTNACLVYSFGINNDFSFDDDVIKKIGCTVHSFDLSMKMESKKRHNKNYFHQFGLYGYSGLLDKKWKVETLKSIREKLNHQKKRIDVLKFDIESSEWSALPEMIASGQLDDVPQLLFELHINKAQSDFFVKSCRLLESLRLAGFTRFRTDQNIHCIVASSFRPQKKITNCWELYYLNDRFANGTLAGKVT